ncbi:MAG: lanthionine synthetase C family protein [Lachnospiraceae bacterium]|nr:lanthionine synthetase C family protein [Lachnospiraceae bacterium]
MRGRENLFNFPSYSIRDNKNIKFIDFETARHEYDSEVKETFITPGYVTVNQVDALHGDLQKICIALMECIYPYTQMFFKFPYKIVECIESLMSTGVVDSKFLKLYEEIFAGRILRADEALRFLDSSVELKRVLNIARKTPKEMQKGLLTTLKNNYNRYNNREIYNIPCDAAGYNTNNYSLAYGSAGVLNALIYMNEYETVRNCPDVIRELIKSVYSGKVHTQGLYLGKSGIAVSLLKAGFNEQAECIMKTVSISNIAMADISYGIAGVMMADIEFYMSTEDDYYRRDYYACVEKLRSLKDDERIRWKDAVGDYYHGFTRGNAGIALALLQGLILFDDDSLKKLSIEVLEEDIKAIEYGTEGEIKGFSSLPDSKSTKIYSPYVHSGLCGIGIVLIRFGLVTGDKRFEMIVDDILGSLKNRRPLFAGWLRGITGILSFINDCIYYLNRNDLYELRNYYLRLSCLYCVGEDECKLIGDELYAASDDLFTGSSGLLMELYRSFNNVISNGFIIGDNAFYKYKNTNERGYRDYDRSIIGPSEAC